MSQIRTALEGNYASGTNGVESWNEGHCGGTLWDYKKGPTNPIDPSKVVGTYTYVAVGRSGSAVQYSYTGGPTFTYYVQVPASGNVYTFCPTTGGTNLTITVNAGSCPP